ncbi:MAG: FCD domain-containing protein [Pseudomonadota bacterium]
MSVTFQPLKKEPAYLKVYQAIEEKILSGQMDEGAVLPTETDLCAQLGVTRATVREGLRLLEQVDLIERGAAKRFYVKRPDASDIAATTSKGFALGGITFREVWEALRAMYPEAARMAAERLTTSDIAALEDTHERLKVSDPEASDATVDLAVEFFQRLARGLNNRVLLAMLQSLNMMIGVSLRNVIAGTPDPQNRIILAQAEIISALKNRDADKASRWLARHVDDLRRGYEIAGVDLDVAVV